MDFLFSARNDASGQQLLPCAPAFDNTAEHDHETAGTKTG